MTLIVVLQAQKHDTPVLLLADRLQDSEDVFKEQKAAAL